MRREEAPVGVMGAGVVGGALLEYLRGAGRHVQIGAAPLDHDLEKFFDADHW